MNAPTDTAVPFPELPRTPRGHLTLRFYEAVLALVRYARHRTGASGSESDPERGEDPVLESHPFLGGYLRELDARLGQIDARPPGPAAFRAAASRWERATEARLPLRALRIELELDEAHVVALMLVGLVEEDPRFGDVFAAAQGAAGARRPTVALLHQVARVWSPDAAAEPWSFARPLLDARLLEVLDAEQPRADWQLRVPVPLWTALGGDAGPEPFPGTRWRPAGSWEALDALVLHADTHSRLAEACALLARGDATALVVRGLPGSERLELVGAAARSLGRGVLEAGEVRDALLGPLATLLGGVPVFIPDPAPGESFAIPGLRGFRGPVAVVLGRDGGVTARAAENVVTLELPPEPASLRRRHWERALPEARPELHAALADGFMLGGRHIRRAAALARTHAALERRPSPCLDDARSAARAVSRQQLDSLAARLDDGGGWDRLVLHATTATELRHLERRCRHRERLTTAIGDALPGGMNRGVRALFQGPSGTGKTLAARVLASELGLDLYRVDLSSVVSKYIGETEKNLSRVLGRAEDLDVVLLLDEGDSLLGKRTEVRSSHDRWANMETNYLLQRLDIYTGIVVVTTNLPGSVDAAFQRRMDVVVRFHLPSVEERWHLWQQHLPADHDVDPDAIEAAALRYELTGGQIRNAAVDAALLALASPGGRVRAHDLAAAVHAEYRKAGAAPPRARQRNGDDRHDAESAMASFLDAIR